MSEYRPPETGQPRSLRWPLNRLHTIIGGVAVGALALGLLGGAYVGPLGGPAPSVDAGTLRIAHVDAKPAAIVPGGKLDVLAVTVDEFQGLPERARDDMELAFADEAYVDAYAPPEPIVVEPARPVRFERPAEPARVRRYTSDQREDCTFARSRAEAMLCRDDRLAAADRAMHMALKDALEDGADPRRVMQDQAAWESARERAAIDGVGAVDRLYRIRIDELEGRR